MEPCFEKSRMGQSESAVTPDGIKITFVHRTKSLIIVYYDQKLIAECKNREDALTAVSKYMRGGN